MEEKIIELSSKIKSLNHCGTCGGTHQNGTCIFCGRENQELIYLSFQLEKELSKLPDKYFEIGQLNTCLTSLYLLRNMQISSVTNTLNNYDYINTVNTSYIDMFAKIKEVFQNQEQLSDNQYHLLLHSYLNDEFNESIQLSISSLFIKKIIEQKEQFNISDLDKEKLFLKSTELMATQILGFKKAHARILEDTSSKKENTLGQAFFNNIDLSRKIIHNDPVKVLSTIFHELIHLKQYKEQKVDYLLSQKNLLEIKDSILSGLLKDYYNSNYSSISFEKEAFLYMNLETIDYLNSVDLDVPREIKEQANFYHQTCNDYVTNKSRVYLDEVVDIEDLFKNQIASHPEKLTEYPQLLFEYKIVENQVFPKTLEEIQKDYECYQNGTLNWNGNQEEINSLYQNKMDELGKSINK